MSYDRLLVYRFISVFVSMHRFQHQTQCRRYPTELLCRRETRTKTMDGCALYTALSPGKKGGHIVFRKAKTFDRKREAEPWYIFGKLK